MFQLIVAVISIALIAALAIASIFYGGDAFNKGSLKANVTTLVNGGQQIAGAQALYRTDNAGANAADVAALVAGEYLVQNPAVSGAATGEWEIDATGRLASVLVVTGSNQLPVCIEGAKQSADALPVAPLPADEPANQFGCFTVDNAGETEVHFGFKI